MTTPAELIAEHNKIRAHLKAQDDLYAKYKETYTARQQAIESELHKMLLELNGGDPSHKASFSTDAGTAYLSTIETPSLDAESKNSFLDWIEEDWEARAQLLTIGTPPIAEVRSWRDTHNALPPYVTVKPFIRLNINTKGAKK